MVSDKLDLPQNFFFHTFTNATLSRSSSGSAAGPLNLNASSPKLTDFNAITGPLSLKCISRALVFQIDTSETPIDPVRTVLRSEIISSGTQPDAVMTSTPTKKVIYRFLGTPHDPIELELRVDFSLDSDVHSALEMFDDILEQYVADFKRITAAPSSVLPSSSSFSSSSQTLEQNQDKIFAPDLRNQFILVNEETGQVLGQIEDDKLRIIEDPSTHQAACEDGDTTQTFRRVVPPHQETWITKSASVVSDAISTGTDLLLTTITAASSYYINHSNPSPYHSSSGTTEHLGSLDTIETAPSSTTSDIHNPSPSLPQPLVFFTSSKTRQGLSIAHAISTEAVAVSSKTVGLVDGIIQQVMEGSKTPAPEPTPAPSQSLSPVLNPAHLLPGASMPIPTTSEAQPPARISTANSILTSADLILSTLDNSTRRVFNTGTEQFGKVVGHKYGPEAAHSSLMLAGTARNIGLFFVDMTGIGRRVLVKSGTALVKARV